MLVGATCGALISRTPRGWCEAAPLGTWAGIAVVGQDASPGRTLLVVLVIQRHGFEGGF